MPAQNYYFVVYNTFTSSKDTFVQKKICLILQAWEERAQGSRVTHESVSGVFGNTRHWSSSNFRNYLLYLVTKMDGDLGLVHLNAFPASRLAAAGQTFAFVAVPDDKGRPQARLVSAAGRHAVMYAHNDSDGGSCSFLDLNHRAEEALSLVSDPSGRLIAVCERRSQSSSAAVAPPSSSASGGPGSGSGGSGTAGDGDAVAQLSVYHASSRECLRTMTFRVPRAAFGGDAAARASFGFLQAEFSGDAASTYLAAYAAAPGGACGHIVLFKWRSATAVAVHALGAGVRVSRLRVSPHGVARADGSLAPLSTLQLSVSGPGLCRSLRVTQEGDMAEAPLLHPTREAAADFVDHCWLRAGPPPVVTAGAAAAGLDTSASGSPAAAGGVGGDHDDVTGEGSGGGSALGANKRAWGVSVARERRLAAITADGHVYIIAKADSSSAGPGTSNSSSSSGGGPIISKTVSAPSSSSLAGTAVGVAVAEIWELKTVMRIALPSVVVQAQTAALQALPGGVGSTLADAGLGWGLHDGKQSATGHRHHSRDPAGAGAASASSLRPGGGGRASGMPLAAASGAGADSLQLQAAAAARETLASSGPAAASVLALKAGILATAGSETLVLHGIVPTGRGFVVAGSHGLVAVFERADTASGARMKGMAAAVMAAAAGTAASTASRSASGIGGITEPRPGAGAAGASGTAASESESVGTLLPGTSDPFVCVRALLAAGGLTIRSVSLSLNDDVAALLTLQRGLCTLDLAAAELDDGLDSGSSSSSSAAAAGLGASNNTSAIVLPPAAGSIRLGVSLSPVLGAGTHTRAVSHLSLSVAQPRMLTCAADGTIRLWDYQDARCETVLHTSSAEAGAGGNGGGGGAGSGAALAERLKASVGLSSLSVPGSKTGSKGASTSGPGAAPGSPQGTDTGAGAPTDILAAARADANDALSVSMHPSGLMAAAGFRERVVVYNACAASLVMWQSVTLRGAYCVAYSLGGAYLAVSAGAVLHIYSAWNMAPLLVLAGHTSQIRDIAWAANDSCIASVGDDGGVLLWSIRSEYGNPRPSPSRIRYA